MKKTSKLLLLMTLICTLIFCGIMSASALEAYDKCGENVNYTYNKSTGELIISGTGKMYDDFIDFNEKDIKSVVIKNGVTSISRQIFYNCDKLTSVTLPNTLTVIPELAFAECDSLKSISIPDSVTVIDANAFWSCDKLETITIGSGVVEIDPSALECESLKSLTVSVANTKYSSKDGILFNKSKTELIKYPPKVTKTEYVMPDSVVTIFDNAFSENDSLKKITLSKDLEKIGARAFFSCENIETITIPSKVEFIGENAFQWCFSLTSITVNSKNETFSSSNGVLFSNNKSTLIAYPCGKTNSSYTIPDSVTHIGDHAFFNSNLKKVIISNNVVNIGYDAFGGCTSLKDVTIPGSVKNIGAYAFSGCHYLTKVTIEPGVENIGESAFSTCSALSEITLPATIKVIAKDAFSDCIFLTKVNFNGTRTQWSGIKVKTGNTALTSASIKYLDDCDCHSVGLSRWIFKIKVFFWRFVGKNKQCICGTAHY